VADLLEPVGRRERRMWGETYVRGLLLDGERKSIEPMAARVPGGNVQAMQQFIGQSPWGVAEVRARLARRMEKELCPAAGWIVDDTGFPKQGRHSVGVARQYSGTLGKTGNCQVAVSLHLATDDASVPLDFELYLPESWVSDAERRRKAGIPKEIVFRTKWQIALALIDRAIDNGLTPGVVTADAGYGIATAFRDELAARRLAYMLGVIETMGAWTERVTREVQPPYGGRGRPRRPRYTAAPPTGLLEIARSLPPGAYRTITWRRGRKGPLRSRFAALRVQPAHGHIQQAPEQPMVWVLIDWPVGADKPEHYWFSNLPESTGLRRLVRHAMLRWHCEQDYQQAKEELGLDHYEGRGWLGWHHHVTMVQIAQTFLAMERLRQQKKLFIDPSGDPESDADHAAAVERNLPNLPPPPRKSSITNLT
jgi:SRSO17 transposase